MLLKKGTTRECSYEDYAPSSILSAPPRLALRALPNQLFDLVKEGREGLLDPERIALGLTDLVGARQYKR